MMKSGGQAPAGFSEVLAAANLAACEGVFVFQNTLNTGREIFSADPIMALTLYKNNIIPTAIVGNVVFRQQNLRRYYRRRFYG